MKPPAVLPAKKASYKCLMPDPILKLRRIVGFGGATMRDVRTPVALFTVRASWGFSLFWGESGTWRGGDHSVEDHYLHKTWIIFGGE